MAINMSTKTLQMTLDLGTDLKEYFDSKGIKYVWEERMVQSRYQRSQTLLRYITFSVDEDRYFQLIYAFGTWRYNKYVSPLISQLKDKADDMFNEYRISESD